MQIDFAVDLYRLCSVDECVQSAKIRLYLFRLVLVQFNWAQFTIYGINKRLSNEVEARDENILRNLDWYGNNIFCRDV